MYTIIELQTENGQTAVVTPITRETRDEAESEWHRIMSTAAMSTVDIHSAVILNEEGQIIKTGCYKHD